MPDRSIPMTGHTRLFGIVADPITHVVAPQTFGAVFAERGIDAMMLPFHVRPDRVKDAFTGFKALANLDGLVVTVPHKFAFARLMDDLGPHARRTGAVNVVRCNPDGRWFGELFDGLGFVEGLRSRGISPAGKSFLIYGAGGAGTAIVSALLTERPSRIVVTDVAAGKAEAMCRALAVEAPGLALEATTTPDPAGFDIVVNATPMGLEEDPRMPFDPSRMKPDAVAAEVIMMPPVTRLLEDARRRGLRTHEGSLMLRGQLELMLGFFGFARRV